MDSNALLTRKQIGYVVGFFLLLLVSVVLYTFITRVGKTKVDIVVLPRDSTITANGHPISQGENYLKPGSYTFTAKRQDFDTVSLKYSIGNKPLTVNLLPAATSDAAVKYLEQNPQVDAQIQAIADAELRKSGTATLKKYPLFNQLPIIYDHGDSSIGSGPSTQKPGDTAVIVKDISTNGRMADIGVIRQFNYDPADYIVEFNDFVNPLASQQTEGQE